MAPRMVICKKLQRELPGLDAAPWPGELGQRVYDNVSAEAWKLWEERMKMILNEYRLMPWQKEAQQLVAKHMEDFFFGEGAALPPGLRAAPGQAVALSARTFRYGRATAKSAGTIENFSVVVRPRTAASAPRASRRARR